MSSVWDDFRNLFDLKKPSREHSLDPIAQVSEQEWQERFDDFGKFSSTTSYSEYTAWLRSEIDNHEPLPEHGSDVAMCYTFTQKGLRMALRRLELMKAAAEERRG